MATLEVPSSGAARHLLPDGEKNKWWLSHATENGQRPDWGAFFLSPSGRGWIGRKAETGEGAVARLTFGGRHVRA